MTFRATKDPQADLDYAIDWSAWLATDTITQSEWRVASSSGLTLHDDGIESGRATVWIRGGKMGGPYAVVNRITTAAGRVDERTIFLQVEQK